MSILRYLSPEEGIMRFKEAREPNPSYIGPNEIIECVGNKQFRFSNGKCLAFSDICSVVTLVADTGAVLPPL